jgi:HEAT repeat protein
MSPSADVGALTWAMVLVNMLLSMLPAAILPLDAHVALRLEEALRLFRPKVARLEGKRDVDALCRALVYKEPEVRAEAASALGRLADPRAVEPLCAVLRDDEYALVREAAAIALADLGGARALEQLIAVLDDFYIAAEVQSALGRFSQSDDQALTGLIDDQALIRLLESGGVNARRWAVEQLARRRAVDPLMGALWDPDESVRQTAAISLGQLRDPRAIELLVHTLSSIPGPSQPDHDVELWAATTGALRALEGPSLVEPLVGALETGNRDVRVFAIEVLEELDDPRAVEALNPEPKIGDHYEFGQLHDDPDTLAVVRTGWKGTIVEVRPAEEQRTWGIAVRVDRIDDDYPIEYPDSSVGTRGDQDPYSVGDIASMSLALVDSEERHPGLEWGNLSRDRFPADDGSFTWRETVDHRPTIGDGVRYRLSEVVDEGEESEHLGFAWYVGTIVAVSDDGTTVDVRSDDAVQTFTVPATAEANLLGGRWWFELEP